MRALVFLAVAGLGVWFLASHVLADVRDEKAVLESAEQGVQDVADVLAEATRRAREIEQPAKRSPEEERWASRVNAECRKQSSALRRLPTPRSLEAIAAYLADAAPILHRRQRRLAALEPPRSVAGPAQAAMRSLDAQRRGVSGALEAARQGDSSLVLDRTDDLRLARRSNPRLVSLGLTDCTLPGWGIPL